MNWEFGIVVYLVLDFGLFLAVTGGIEYNLRFNPIQNYKDWDMMNWFGVLICTILYWMLFLPVSIVVGVFSGIRKLFTIGRR